MNRSTVFPRLGQTNGDDTAGRREADGVIEDILDNDLDITTRPLDQYAIVQMPMKADVMLGQRIAPAVERIRDDLREIDLIARRHDHVGDIVIHLLRRGDQDAQPTQRCLDQLHSTPATLVVFGNQATDGIERRLNRRQRRLERMRVLFGCLPDIARARWRSFTNPSKSEATLSNSGMTLRSTKALSPTVRGGHLSRHRGIHVRSATRSWRSTRPKSQPPNKAPR